MNLCQAVNNALHVAMETDSGAVAFGEDIAFGGVFRCSVGLQEKFGNRRLLIPSSGGDWHLGATLTLHWKKYLN